jgi:putative transposase
MAYSTYSQIYLHIVFSVKGREKVLKSSFRDEILKFITSVIQTRNHKVREINGVEDHIHILIGYNPTQTIPDLVRDIKTESSKFINQKRFIRGHFGWQEGYGVFSIGTSELDRIHEYIRNQEVHHLEESSIGEIQRFLKHYGYDNLDQVK